MTCNCKNAQEDTIQFIKGTTVNLTFIFEDDISTYTGAIFTIRKNYGETPIISKTVSITDLHTINITLSKGETNTFNNFENGKESDINLWGLDVVDSDTGSQINVFPQAGNPAPLCIVYKHIVEEG